jgi:hypothetical protein
MFVFSTSTTETEKTGGTEFLVLCTEYCKSRVFYLFSDDQNKYCFRWQKIPATYSHTQRDQRREAWLRKHFSQELLQDRDRVRQKRDKMRHKRSGERVQA